MLHYLIINCGNRSKGSGLLNLLCVSELFAAAILFGYRRSRFLLVFSIVGVVIALIIPEEGSAAVRLPNFKAPTVRTPTIRAPTVRTPTVRTPTVRAPSVTQPKVVRPQIAPGIRPQLGSRQPPPAKDPGIFAKRQTILTKAYDKNAFNRFKRVWERRTWRQFTGIFIGGVTLVALADIFYDGPGYVDIAEYGVVEIPAVEYETIYIALTSSNDDERTTAMARVNTYAQIAGLVEPAITNDIEL